ncbi:MAG TPA: hypothetical protein VFA74_02925 [Terriglobales bacterium]|nr:hypothetical protein [Terriglobales bacterium]
MRNFIFTLLIAVAAVPVFAEALPEAPALTFSSGSTAYETRVQTRNFVATKPPTHRFFERGNSIRLVALTGLVAADGLTTQTALSGSGHFREINPIARPFVNEGTGGQVAASAIGLGVSAGSAYLLHKTGHHRLERLVLNASIGIEAETVSGNTWHLVR